MEAKYVVEFERDSGIFGSMWIFANAYKTKAEASAASKRISAYQKKTGHGGSGKTRIVSMATYKKSIKQ